MKEDFIVVKIIFFGDDPVLDWQFGSKIVELNAFVLDDETGKGCKVA